MSLKRQHSLCKSAQFGHVFQDARKIHGVYFTILYRPNPLTHARLGLIISKKHCQNAVRRNLLRRLIKVSFVAVLPQLPPMDIIVLSKPCLRQQLIRDWRLDIPKALQQQWAVLINKTAKAGLAHAQ